MMMDMCIKIPAFLERYQNDFSLWEKRMQKEGDGYILGRDSNGRMITCKKNEDFLHLIEYVPEDGKKIIIFPNYGILSFKDDILVESCESSFDFLFDDDNEQQLDDFTWHMDALKRKEKEYLYALLKNNDIDTYQKVEKNFQIFNKDMENSLLHGMDRGNFSSMLACCLFPVIREDKEIIAILGRTGRIPDDLLKEYNTLEYIYNSLYEKMHESLSRGDSPEDVRRYLLREARIMSSYRKEGKLSLDFFTDILFSQRRKIAEKQQTERDNATFSHASQKTIRPEASSERQTYHFKMS